MEKLKSLRQRSPILVGLIVMVLFFIIAQLINLLVVYLNVCVDGFKEYSAENPYLIQLVSEIVFSIYGLVAAYILGFGDVFKNHRTGFLKGLIPGLYLVCAAAYTLFVTLVPKLSQYGSTEAIVLSIQPAWKIVVFVMTCLLIGFAEELVFRGIIAEGIFQKYATDAKGVWFCAIVSAFLFGVMHLTNMTLADPVGVACQAVVAMAEGLLITAIYYRSRNIWTTTFIHAFIDFCALAPSALFIEDNGKISNVVSSYRPMMMSGMLIFFGITAIVLRNSKIRIMLGKEDVHSTPESNKRFKVALIVTIVIVAIAMAFAILDMSKYLTEMLMQMKYDDSIAQETQRIKDIMQRFLK